VRIVPSGLNLVGTWNGGTDYADVWGEGNFAYIGHRSGEQGMDIIDISNPTHPVLAAVFMGTGDNNLRDQEIQNNIGFFGSNNAKTGGIYVVDLHDPYHPQQLAFITPAMGALPSLHSIGVDGNYLYETDGGTPNIAVFDISSPSQPKYVRTLVSPSRGPYHEVTPKNGRLYATVLNNPGYTDIWDVSNVGNTGLAVPLTSETATGVGTHTAWPTDDGNYMVVSHEVSGGTEQIWDIHDPAHPRLVSTIPPLPTTQAFSSHQPMIKGNLLYTSWYQAGMFVYDISDPTDPVLVGNYNTYGLPVTGTYQGNWGVYAFLGDDRLLASDMSNGLFVLSLPHVSISGTVFTDRNGNGVLDSGEPKEAGQTVYVDTNHNGVLDPGEPTAVTDAKGNYSFTGLQPGAYRVREVVPSGDTQTTANPTPISGALDGTSVTGVNFGNFQLASMSGTVYTDTNGNGVRDASEPGLAGQTVYLDQNQDATLDQDSTGVGSVSQNMPLTIPAGGVLYSNLLAQGFAAPIGRIGVTLNISYPNDGDLTISLLTPWGSKILLVNQRGSAGQNFTQTILSDTATAPIARGVAPFTGRFLPEQPLSSAIGQNPNGTWKLQIMDSSATRSGSLIGWSITFFTAEPSVQTDANGNFTFTGLGPGRYTVRALPASGWGTTSANPIVTSITTSGAARTGLAFGAYQLGTVSGTVFNDANGNGVQDSGEAGLAGRTVFLDQNQDGVQNTYPATVASSGSSQAIPDLSTLTTGLTVTGLAGPISNLNVMLNIVHPFDQDLKIYLVSPTGTHILLVNRRGGSGHNFTGTILSDQASIPISQGTAPFTGSYQPEQPLAAVNGQSPDGTWLLEISDVAKGDVGSLSSWSLAFTVAEPAVQTDANGHYSFTGLFHGSYTVSAVLPSGWTATTATSLTVTVSTTATTLANENFGQMQPMGTVTPSLGASPSALEGQHSSQPFLQAGPTLRGAASKAQSNYTRLLEEVFTTMPDRFDPAALDVRSSDLDNRSSVRSSQHVSPGEGAVAKPALAKGFDTDRKPTREKGQAPGVPTWSLVAVFAWPDGGFAVLY
jgi:subtilisin-like proprotein convertase family protein